MIQNPTIGRVVYVYNLAEPEPRKPYTGLVADVGVAGDPLCINCAAVARDGNFFEGGLQAVPHISRRDDATVVWDWMPFQKGQQSKTEELEKRVAGAIGGLSGGQVGAIDRQMGGGGNGGPVGAFTMPPGRSIERIALACHEANRAICEAIGDTSQKAWHAAEQWQRDSAIKGVEFALANPNATPADQHQAWMREKFADGWSHGERKDPARKLHPCLVPYDVLPTEQRVKDHVFRAIVQALR